MPSSAQTKSTASATRNSKLVPVISTAIVLIALATAVSLFQ